MTSNRIFGEVLMKRLIVGLVLAGGTYSQTADECAHLNLNNPNYNLGYRQVSKITDKSIKSIDARLRKGKYSQREADRRKDIVKNCRIRWVALKAPDRLEREILEFSKPRN